MSEARESGGRAPGDGFAVAAPAGLAGLAVPAVLAVLAAILTVVVQAVVFPHGSINNDEAIYRLQAQALQHGHLFTPVVAPAAAFRPWLAAVVGHHWVLKYIPVEGSLLAVAGALGSPYVALPVVAAAAAVATWLLIGEVFDDRRVALVATLLVVLSPLVVVQSALLVGYLLTLVLLEVFAWTVFRLAHQPRARWAVIGGLALGLAGVARPYDTFLFALPVVVWAVARLRRRVVGPLFWYVLGVLPPLVGMLLYDWAATGSPWRLPFNLLEPADKPGFGPRRMFPQEPYHAFGLGLGIRGSTTHLALTAVWVAGGPVLVALAAVGMWRRRRSGAAMALAALAVTFPVGYVFFWGAWNASQLWRGVRFVGPFYFLPLVVPLAAFGGAELVVLFRRWRLAAVAVVALGLVSSVLVAAPALAADARWSRQDGAVLALVNRQVTPTRPALVLIESDQEYVMHPISGLANRWDGAGPLVYGLWSGTDQDLTVLATEPDRQPFVLTLFGPFAPHPAHLAATLRPVSLKTGPAVTIHVTLSAGAAATSGLAVELVGPVGPPSAALSCPSAVVGGGWDISVTSAQGLHCTGPGGDQSSVPPTGAAVPSGAGLAAGLAPPAILAEPAYLSGPNTWSGSLQLRSAAGATLTLPVRISQGNVTVVSIGPPVGAVGRPPVGQLAAE